MLLVFSDDWGRHPSSCQHLVRRLLDRHRVLWVNTIGMRPPTLDLATAARALEKLRHWSARADSGEPLPPNLQVINPRMWPWFRRQHDRWLNRQMLSRSLGPLLERAGEPVTAITTIPIVADLVGELPVERWVYYCVDDFTVWPGLDQQAMLAMERTLVERCDEIVAVSETLQERLARWGRDSTLLTHGVDLDFWQRPAPSDDAILPASVRGPRVVFWGVIDRRMDTQFVARLAADLNEGSIVLAGPLDHPDEALLRLPNVRHVPPLPLARLPQLAVESDVLVMPYADLPVTRAIQPLKLKEYLATGKPVVVRDLPATRPWADCLDIAASAEEFSRIVRQRLVSGVPAEQLAARSRLADESWDAKAVQFEAIVTAPSGKAARASQAMAVGASA